MPAYDREHAERMDHTYRWMKYVYDATRPFFLFGRKTARQNIIARHPGCVVEMGCGTGVNLLGLAKALPQAHFCGVEISAEMRDYAAKRIVGLAPKRAISIIAGDAASVDLGVLRPDAILFSYSLSMIPDWRSALRNAWTQLTPGGMISIVDFGRFESWPGFLKRRIHKNMSYFHTAPRENLLSFLESDAVFNDAHIVSRPLFGGCAEITTMTRKAD